MKKITRILFLASLLPVVCRGATISGRVMAGVAGTTGYNSVPGVTVKLISGAGSQTTVVDTAVSDTSGSYAFAFSALGFMQVVASAVGAPYDPPLTPDPNVTVVAVNSDTVNLTVNISFKTAGSANVPGTSSIGGRLTSGADPVSAQVVLRRRATASAVWVLVDSAMSDSTGVFLFSNILEAGPQTSAFGYSLVVNSPGYVPFTSGNLTVAANQVVVSNIDLTAAAGLHSAVSGIKHGIRFFRVGDQLVFDLGPSNTVRRVSVLNPNGALQYRVSVSAGESHASVPAIFGRGFLFQVR